MKRSLFIFCAFLLTIFLLAFTFNTEPNYENLLEDEYKKEYFSKTTSELLRSNLLNAYAHDFDDIKRVDLHKDASDEFYFVVYGKKDNQALVQRISATEEMATQQYYPSRSDMGFSEDAVVINCYCNWIFCLPKGSGKVCGLARDTMSNCRPSALCPIEIDPDKIKPIDIDE